MPIEQWIGKQLGRYKITGLLGRGGMAAVFQAEDTLLHRPVALKVLYEQYVADAALVERFRREAIIAARLEHPNIVPIYDVGESDGTVYIAMKFLAGRSLQDELLLQRDMSPDMVLNIINQVAAALDYAHAHNVVHRDIKPGNVFLNDDGRVLLTDFGIAKSLDAPGMTTTGMIIGTPDYMAPEQIDSKIGMVDARADIYALGIMAYRMLTGERPFDGSTTDVLLAHLTKPAEAASVRNPYLPPSIDAVLSRAMAKNPVERISSAGAFARALSDAVGTRTAVGDAAPPLAVQRAPAGQHAMPQVAATPQLSQRKRKSTKPILAMLAGLMAISALLVAWTINRATARTQALKAEQTATVQAFATTEAGIVPTATKSIAPSATLMVNATATTGATTTVAATDQPSATVAGVAPQPSTVAIVQPTKPPIIQPTAVPIVQPTKAPPPPTRTPAPPPPTDTPACAGPLAGGFGMLWRNNPDIANALGCPTNAEVGGVASIQYFDGGMMYWWQNSDRIYVYYGGSSGSWQRFANPNDPSYNEPRETDVPAGKIEPVRGFGTIWHTIAGVRDALGWGNSPEYPITGVVQVFPNGMMVYSPPLEGRSARIWVMYNDGSWVRYVDPNG